MNKKQKNRKLVKQNKRNRIINRRYSSTIKTLSKLFKNKIKNFNKENENENQNGNEQKLTQVTNETKSLVNKLYSIMDKAVKKGVIHRNTAARKKSKIAKASRFNG